jgi:glycosyltransferase involved in cell wall biosynthesis
MSPKAPPRIVVNGRFLARRVTGVERYGHEILRCIGNELRIERAHRQGLAGHLWEQLVLPSRLGSGSILWSPANTGPVWVREQALTIHDLSPLEHPEWFRASFATWYRLFLPVLARRVQKVFTPSEYVKQKVMRRFGITNVIVTPNGVDRSVFHPGARQARFDLPERYLLFVGTLEPRKNVSLLLQAWNEVRDVLPDVWLVVVGAGGNVFRPAHLLPSIQQVRFLGYVDDQTLAGLYAQATLFVLPSQEEGFGLPALEAMACGTPVVVSDGGALPEVVGDAGLTFKLHEAERATGTDPARQLATMIAQCLGDEHLRRALSEMGLSRAGQFSWQATADLVWRELHGS